MSILDYWTTIGRRHPSTVILFAGLYLESKGLRFVIDYGVINAIPKAVDLCVKQMEQEFL